MRRINDRFLLAALGAVLMLTACGKPSKEGAPGLGSAPEETETAPGPAPGALGGLCAGIAGIACVDEGAYCQVEPGVCSNTVDYAGQCAIKPEICTQEYRPVCGCDGETYSNACSAAASGASIAYEGACKEGE